MFSSTQPVSLGYLPDHLASQAAKSRRASGRSRRSYSHRSSCRQSSSTRRGAPLGDARREKQLSSRSDLAVEGFGLLRLEPRSDGIHPSGEIIFAEQPAAEQNVG